MTKNGDKSSIQKIAEGKGIPPKNTPSPKPKDGGIKQVMRNKISDTRFCRK